jgi:hypothetical protein
MVDIMKIQFPLLEGRLPSGRFEEQTALVMDNSEVTRDSMFAPRPLEHTVVNTVQQLLEIEQGNGGLVKCA